MNSAIKEFKLRLEKIASAGREDVPQSSGEKRQETLDTQDWSPGKKRQETLDTQDRLAREIYQEKLNTRDRVVRENCQKMLDSQDRLTREDRSHLMREMSTESIREDFFNYELDDGRNQACDWMDVEAIRSQLLIDFAADDKVPILSENDACDVIMKQGEKPSLDFPSRLADYSFNNLERSDVMFEYRYWAHDVSVCEKGMDNSVHCSVTIRSKNSNPYEQYPSWAIPLLMIAEETRYAFPLIEDCKRNNRPRSTRYHIVDDGDDDHHKSCLLDRTRIGHIPSIYQILVINYKTFDSVIPVWVIKLCFDVLMQKLDFSSEVQNGTVVGVDPAKNERRFKMMVEYFLKMPIDVTSDISFYEVAKARGIPRGCYFSGLIRTMSNLVITRMLCKQVFCEKAEVFVERCHHNKCVLVFRSDLILNLTAFSSHAKNCFGVVVDQDRTAITANVADFHSWGYCCDDDEID